MYGNATGRADHIPCSDPTWRSAPRIGPANGPVKTRRLIDMELGDMIRDMVGKALAEALASNGAAPANGPVAEATTPKVSKRIRTKTAPASAVATAAAKTIEVFNVGLSKSGKTVKFETPEGSQFWGSLALSVDAVAGAKSVRIIVEK